MAYGISHMVRGSFQISGGPGIAALIVRLSTKRTPNLWKQPCGLHSNLSVIHSMRGIDEAMGDSIPHRGLSVLLQVGKKTASMPERAKGAFHGRRVQYAAICNR